MAAPPSGLYRREAWLGLEGLELQVTAPDVRLPKIVEKLLTNSPSVFYTDGNVYGNVSGNVHDNVSGNVHDNVIGNVRDNVYRGVAKEVRWQQFKTLPGCQATA